MNVLTLDAHLATLAVNGVVTVAVVDALPTRPEWMTQIDRSEWWLCDRCKFSMMSPATHPAPVCPSCGRVPLDLTGQRIGLRAANLDPAVDEAIRLVGLGVHHSLHPGCIVGSAVVEAVVPIVEWYDTSGIRNISRHPLGALFLFSSGTVVERSLSDQLAYQEFTPGKTALILADPAPCEQRCPGCWGSGTTGTLLALCGQVEAYDPDDPCVMRAGHSGPHYHESDVASDWAPAIAEHCPTCLNWSCGTCPPIPFATDETWSVWP